MPRPLKASDLSTATARKRLRPRSKPYWSAIAGGHQLGYRRLSRRPGTWIVRQLAGGHYREHALGSADDATLADEVGGGVVLSYREAQKAAIEWFVEQERPRITGHSVGDAMRSYIAYLRKERRSAAWVQHTFAAHILPYLGDCELADLTSERIEAWRDALAESPARVRTKPGDQQRTRAATSDEDRRRRKVTANRCFAILRAALNRAYRRGWAASPDAWRRVAPYRAVERARVQYLDTEQAVRLLNACEPDFRRLVEGALHTGARYGELARILVSDFKPEAHALLLSETKGGKPRTVFLTEDGAEFFDALCAGRHAGDPIFLRDDGEPWQRAQQQRRMLEACQRAQIDPPVVFHALRHSYASLFVQAGGSLIALSKQLGHTTTRMVERHYAHLGDSWIADEARRHAPKIGTTRRKVTGMRRARRGA